jgi:Fe-S cluster assembly protein SufD
MRKMSFSLKKNEEKIIPFVWINDTNKNECDVQVQLSEEGSNVILLGIFLGTSDSFLKFDTTIHHRNSHTKSLTILRAVFMNDAKFTNDGMIKITKGAKNANAYFDSKVLLFGNAKGRSVPSLEIDENEVKAGHGSTIGRPDADQLLYLKSRGLSEQVATRLLVTGFFQPALKFLDDKKRNTILKKISKTIV